MRDILGFEGVYAITEDGKVWSYPKGSKPHLGKWLKLKDSGFVGKIKRHKREYRKVSLWKEGKHHDFYVHRLVAKAFLPNPLNLPVVNHLDGNPRNNEASNLEWCTNIENLRHAFLNGLTTRGEKNSQTKLTKEQVIEIREKYSKGGTSHAKLGKEYEVSASNIYMILNGRNWNWVT